MKTEDLLVVYVSYEIDTMETVNARAPKDLLDDLDEVAEYMNVTRSAIIRTLIADFVQVAKGEEVDGLQAYNIKTKGAILNLPRPMVVAQVRANVNALKKAEKEVEE